MSVNVPAASSSTGAVPLSDVDSWSIVRKHMPELDVLRGTAILMVLAYHSIYWSESSTRTHGIWRALGQLTVLGWLGVNLFFVLSGFLITLILLETRTRKDFFRRFYLRRACRILPAYLLTLAVLSLLHLITRQFLLLSLAFLANFTADSVAGSFGPLWSLSVEEQFYLVWPAVVRIVAPRHLKWILLVILLIEPVLRALSLLGVVNLGPAHTSTLLMADNLALGAAAALFARSRYGTRTNAVRVAALVALVGAALEGSGLPFGILHRSTAVGTVLQEEPWNLLFTGLLLALLGLRPAWCAGRLGAPLRFLGYISYGLYLFHLIVFAVYDTFVQRFHLPPFFAAVYPRCLIAGLLSIFVAWISRRFYESRFLSWGVRRTS